ncbi:hypothetical protein [Sphingobacterium sp. SGR-19]|uniref:hypothetical protein n=1 Tax=Sphingobacterium sp. SGR-19 TaxID=2710886 RepID=UPI0013E9DB92|nr:hypothetical protein [Sphingobacterium sp. SGR-19]NGM65785.1 hypothetical protein [Sphingobacterium sp. SGR-19]
MSEIKYSISEIKSLAIIVLPCALCLGAAILASYVPILRTLPDDIFAKFLTERLSYVTLAGPMFSLFCTLLVIFAITFINKLRETPTIRLRGIALLPYFLLVAFFGWVLMSLPAEKATVPDPSEPKSLYEIYIEAYPPDPVIEALIEKADLPYYWVVAGMGLIFLVCFKPLHIHFNRLVLSLFSENRYIMPADERPVRKLRVQEEVETVSRLYGTSEELLEAATGLANTYAQDSPSDEPQSFGLDKVAFVYGEDCVYSIIKQGFAIPTIFDERETIESLYGGTFLHINRALYIRGDHITFFDFDNLKIGVSRELILTFHQLNRASVKEKVWSYRSADHSDFCLDIDPDLVDKLKRTLDEDDELE